VPILDVSAVKCYANVMHCVPACLPSLSEKPVCLLGSVRLSLCVCVDIKEVGVECFIEKRGAKGGRRGVQRDGGKDRAEISTT
jgi:hypothetical protein